jgi:hypothetical protein
LICSCTKSLALMTQLHFELHIETQDGLLMYRQAPHGGQRDGDARIKLFCAGELQQIQEG